jgi:hypothetical protein
MTETVVKASELLRRLLAANAAYAKLEDRYYARSSKVTTLELTIDDLKEQIKSLKSQVNELRKARKGKEGS